MTIHSRNGSPGLPSYSRICGLCSNTVSQTGGRYLFGAMRIWTCAACVAKREQLKKDKENAQAANMA